MESREIEIEIELDSPSSRAPWTERAKERETTLPASVRHDE